MKVGSVNHGTANIDDPASETPLAPGSLTFIIDCTGSARDRTDVGLTSTLTSIAQQTHDGWRAIILALPDLTFPSDAPQLLVERRTVDHRSHTWEAINDIVESSISTAVTVVRPGDVILPDAANALLERFARSDAPHLVYTDARTASTGVAILKPAPSPHRLRSVPYFGYLTAMRSSSIVGAGGARSGYDGAEWVDLALRVASSSRTVAHLPDVMIEQAMPHAAFDESDPVETASAGRAVADLRSRDGGIWKSEGLLAGNWPSRRCPEGEPLVSVIIPTRGDSAVVRGVERCLVVEAVRSVVSLTTWSNFEIVVVVDDATPPTVTEELAQVAGDRLRLVPFSRPFSFSEKMNLGVIRSSGEFVLFLNDDIEVITPEWMSAMLALVQLPGAGIVGAMLYFEDDTIQHAGHAYYRDDVTHIALHSARGALGPEGSFAIEREVDGATAACAMMPRTVFFDVGGFTPLLPGNFNDVDLCMKIKQRGLWAYVTPFAELYHFESRSRDPRVAKYEIDITWGRWGHKFWDSDFWPYDPHTYYAARLRL